MDIYFSLLAYFNLIFLYLFVECLLKIPKREKIYNLESNINHNNTPTDDCELKMEEKLFLEKKISSLEPAKEKLHRENALIHECFTSVTFIDCYHQKKEFCCFINYD